MRLGRKINRGIWFILVFLGFLCTYGTADDNNAAPTCEITIKKEAGSRVSPYIFGAQEEIYMLPYFPADHFPVYRRFGVSMLRYPCGTPSDWLLWDDVENGYWTAWAKSRKKIGPDDFLDLCKRYGFEPLLTVNTLSFGKNSDDPNNNTRIHPRRIESIAQGAKYAAQWVKHQNVDRKDGVKFWEIGNEVWVWLTPEEYAKYVKEYSKAMRAVDPTIRLVACGLGHDRGPFNPVWLDNLPGEPKWTPRRNHRVQSKEWTTTLLKDAKGSFDDLAIHIYTSGTSMDPVKNGLQCFSDICHNGKIQRQIQCITGMKSPVKLAITEWCINFNWSPQHKDHFVQKVPHRTWSLTKEQYAALNYRNSPTWMFLTTLAAADFIGQMISSGHVEIAIHHTMCDSIGSSLDRETKKMFDQPLLSPNGLAMQFWREFAGDRTVPLDVQSPSMDVEGKPLPFLSAYATEKDDKTFLILINRSPDQKLNLTICGELTDGCVATEHVLRAASWDTTLWRNADEKEKSPAYTRQDRQLDAAALKKYTLDPSALVCLELKRSLPEKAAVSAIHSQQTKGGRQDIPPRLTKIQRVLIVGNSLTRHGPSTEKLGWPNNWGMAATLEENDYAHQLYQRICDVQIPAGTKPELKIASMLAYAINVPKDWGEYRPDFVVLQMGDNLREPKINRKDFVEPYIRLVNALKKAEPNAVVVIVGLWGRDSKRNDLVQEVAKATNSIYVDLRTLSSDPQNSAAAEGHFQHPGVCWHPGDRGMREIARHIWYTVIRSTSSAG